MEQSFASNRIAYQTILPCNRVPIPYSFSLTLRTVRVEGNVQTNSSEVVRASVLAGLGICNAPTWLFDQEMARGEIQRVLPDWEAAEVPIHLVSPRERRHSAKVKAFAEYVAKTMAAD